PPSRPSGPRPPSPRSSASWITPRLPPAVTASPWRSADERRRREAPADPLRALAARPRRRQDPPSAEGRPRPDPGRRPTPDAARAARAERARGRPALREPVAPELCDRHRVLPARVVHDEVQPEAQRGVRPPARLRDAPPDGARRGRP